MGVRVQGSRNQVSAEPAPHHLYQPCVCHVVIMMEEEEVPLSFVSFCDFRVKAVDGASVDDYFVLVTASNDGFIKMWKIHLEEVRCLLTFAFP